ncbi:MAG: hypothetical protein ACMVY4_17530 [Minwuia sp.]|uniref:hypothetical protein n=1 Tax=Minwuia sp. TaxID=2493630 RepID=UPI003A8C2A3F
MPALDAAEILTVGFATVGAGLVIGLFLLFFGPAVSGLFGRKPQPTTVADELAAEILNRDWDRERAIRMSPPGLTHDDVQINANADAAPLRERLDRAFRRFNQRFETLSEEYEAERETDRAVRKIAACAAPMESYVAMLAGLDGEKVAPLLAIAVHVRNGMKDHGVDLSDPAAAEIRLPGLTLTMAEKVEMCRQAGDTVRINGPLIWLFSLVAVQDPARRRTGRRLWAELHRGAPHVEACRDALELLVEDWARLEGADQFPRGLTPEPI